MYFNARSGNIVFVVVFALLAGCTTIDTKPFEQFNSSLTELSKGAISSLDVTIPLAEERYRKEVESELKLGNDYLLQELYVVTEADNPFFISKPPIFLQAIKFKLGISKTNLVWLEYSNLLLQLSSKELVDDEEFSKLSEELNKNAFDAVQSLKDEPSDTSAKNTAIFSELAIAMAKEYIRTRQKEKLTESLTNNQDSINEYVKHMQSAIVTMAQSSTQEHSEKQQDLTRDLVGLVGGNENGKNDAKIQKIIGDMIDIKTTHSNQMESLQALYTAYGTIPAAHEALAVRLSKSDSSIAAINNLLEKGIQLHASSESKTKVNKAELVQAKADAASSEATISEIIYQQTKLKYSQAQFEYIQAQNALDADIENEIKKKDAKDKKEIADELKLEADTLKESSEALRAAAIAVQDSANEIKKSIINN